MLGNKNTKKKTMMGGVGIALLLCALMVGMTMTNFAQNEAPQVEAELAVANEESNDFMALPDVYEPAQYEYDETSELEGMRSMNQKAFLTEDGKTTLLTASEPVHYSRLWTGFKLRSRRRPAEFRASTRLPPNLGAVIRVKLMQRN